MSAWEACGKSDEWYTPAYIFDALGCSFDLDPCGPERGCHVPTRATFFGAGGLERSWHGFVWMNPPFGGRNGIAPWLNKFFEHGNGIALMPDRTSAPWWQAAAKKANALLFISPKVKFERPDGSLGKSPGCGTVLMSAGSRGRAVLMRATSLGFVALPNHTEDETMTAFSSDRAPAVLAQRANP
jgi:hypothetical protein